jgi:hypothetical protein
MKNTEMLFAFCQANAKTAEDVLEVIKTLPNFLHESKVMAWAEDTPLREHKEREEKGVEIIIPIIPSGKKIEPLPLSRATTELRRAYPYIFDCAAYAKTHNPEKIETDEFYSRFTMSYDVFLDYCLDGCEEQTQYLKEEIYKLIRGQPAKYIKVSEKASVLAPPVIIAFKRTKLDNTGKDKRIHNLKKTDKDEFITDIKQDEKVDLVQVQILRELLDVSHGYLNLPKAPYAKIRRAFNFIKELSANPNVTAEESTTTQAELKLIDFLQAQKQLTDELDQGGYHAAYLAFEYILANKKGGAKQQSYNFIDICEKCYPELVQYRDDKRYFNRGTKVHAFLVTLQMIVIFLLEEPAFGIKQIEVLEGKKDGDYITVFFKKTKQD